MIVRTALLLGMVGTLAGWVWPSSLQGGTVPLPAGLAPLPPETLSVRKVDWLLQPAPFTACAYRGAASNELVLDNGLVRRTWLLAPNGATVGLDNRMTKAALLRGVKPEALLTVDGREVRVGGLLGQPNYAFLLPEWAARLTNDVEALQLESVRLGRAEATLGWKQKRHAANLPWPPPGVAADFTYRGATETTHGLAVTIHYELYDGLPVMGKWLTVSNLSQRAITVDGLTTELLALVEGESAVDARESGRWRLPAVSVISDYSFGGMDPTTANRVAQWLPDPQYLTQVHYERKTPALLACRAPAGPGVRLEPGQSLASFRIWVVVHDSDTRERQGLALRRAQRVLAPWLTENPIMMHVRNADTKTFRNAVDQCADVGFEMIIYTFGSGLEMENVNPDYLTRIKADVDYAHSKGIEVGAYSLFSSRRIDDVNDVINPKTGKTGGAIFGNAPCMGSVWATNYLAKIKRFMEATGLDLLEHDGPYPGDLCASTSHPGHRGLEDSQWTQWRTSGDLYRWCRERGIYVNAPDYYFLTGSSKTGMGYREDNWSLPRAQQILHGRQNIYDGTWEKTPTMGWMFVPLTEYHGGGAAATLEPLRDHLPDYEAHLVNNFGAGVQACFRGPRLYDSEPTRELLKKWVSWFKLYRDILESDVIHWRRADGRDLDGYIHVNPNLKHCGLAMLFNPLPQEVERTVELPLYYTGLDKTAMVRQNGDRAKRVWLDRDYTARIDVKVPAQSRVWLLIDKP